ncbi:dihydrolipoamide acetyltransferase [Volvox carteri f. nagariensis]|uniref:Acetyltransferase component of pyruvate dehydrogenase complex n=1 Tax=Volvox carteri f. nagariensis TaxID=3068 RepID=D8TL92_VOLCA|nr:dihydrolipoamide acetyltransferase [Volvox carteri f. nagariensis]EFJ51831.1 dihydrolipoamide acetyltransferase [Volvox carteri f. nagariensis]|eukprot:XP_002947241.1 dihydrolipoamide acetyltransferase [Volvox carteri f. nagariensis]
MSSGAQRLVLKIARAATTESNLTWATVGRLPWLSSASHARFLASYPAHVVLNMPSLSPTMTQGNITKWRKQPGEQVAPGQILAEVETDKATIEWEAQEEGFMAKHLVPEGTQDIAVGTPVAVLAEEAGDVAGLASFSPGASSPATPVAAASQPATSELPKSTHLPPHQVLNMPALSPTMSQGNIVEWKKKVGDPVAPGDVYCEVETDKATISWESQEEGFVARILLPDGAKDIEVGRPALVLVDDKETVPFFASFTASDAASGEQTPPAPAAATATAAKAEVPPASAVSVQRPPETGETNVAAPAAASTGRLRASPYARKLAAELGVALEALSGTGSVGRIVADDVRGATGSAAAIPPVAAPAAVSSATPQADTAAAYVDLPHNQIRRVVARRLLESKQTVPHYYLTMECRVEEIQQLRERLNALNSAGQKGGKGGAVAPKLSVNDFVVKAAAKALKEVPGVNASWFPDFIRQYNNVDISIAVQTPSGLQVPIVRNADLKSLGAISSEIRALAGKAKEGKLLPGDYAGGTFTVSNLGMYGIKQFAAIVNPPQAAILAVGAMTPTIARVDGVFKEVPTILATLSCDHRVIDGAMGAEWLVAFKAQIENPLLLFA